MIIIIFMEIKPNFNKKIMFKNSTITKYSLWRRNNFNSVVEMVLQCQNQFD